MRRGELGHTAAVPPPRSEVEQKQANVLKQCGIDLDAEATIAQSDFRGQRVYARWTDEAGRLVAGVNRTAVDSRGFPGRVVGEGEPGHWRVAFDGEPDHPNIPAKYIEMRSDSE